MKTYTVIGSTDNYEIKASNEKEAWRQAIVKNLKPPFIREKK